MSKGEIRRLYFDWLLRMIGIRHDGTKECGGMKKMLTHLYLYPFRYDIPRDGNRYEDGIDLRYRFGEECGIDERIVASQLDNCPCSVLEMLVALAWRIENSITGDPDFGDRTGYWFTQMLKNSGLDVRDKDYDIVRVNDILDKVLDREYDADGHGAFFTVDHHVGDMRTAELWYQAMWYLDEQTYRK